MADSNALKEKIRQMKMNEKKNYNKSNTSNANTNNTTNNVNNTNNTNNLNNKRDNSANKISNSILKHTTNTNNTYNTSNITKNTNINSTKSTNLYAYASTYNKIINPNKEISFYKNFPIIDHFLINENNNNNNSSNLPHINIVEDDNNLNNNPNNPNNTNNLIEPNNSNTNPIIHNNNANNNANLNNNNHNNNSNNNPNTIISKKLWKNLSLNEQKYYLYHLNQLQSIFNTSNKEQHEIHNTKIEQKRREIKELNENITNKEVIIEKNIIEDNKAKTEEISKRKGEIDKLEKQINDFPGQTQEIEEKIKNCDLLITNYEGYEGASIESIIEGLKGEKKRLKKETMGLHDEIKNHEEFITHMNESITILSMKPSDMVKIKK